jgi:predicted DNA-binding transcriptional regulator AlpA
MDSTSPEKILNSLSNSTTECGNSTVITAEEAAAIFQKSARTWRNWDATGKTPRPIRIGRSTFWRRDEILAWFTEGCPDRETWEFTNRDHSTSYGAKKSLKTAR